MNKHMKELYDWCHDQRRQAERSLDLFERGIMSFRVNNVDVSEEQKETLRRIINDMTQLIERIEADDQG